MSILDYRGHQLPFEKSEDLQAALQLALTDLTTIGNAAQGLAKDVATTIAREDNRDAWQKSFFDWTVSNVNRLSVLVNQAAAVGAIGMLKSQLGGCQRLSSQRPRRRRRPARTDFSPVRRGRRWQRDFRQWLSARAAPTERTPVTFDFTAGYPGGTFIAQITFATPYSSAPVVQIQQLDSLALIHPRVRDVTATGYVIDCEPFALAALYQVSVTVIHPSDSFD
jgi:hypothetical protein